MMKTYEKPISQALEMHTDGAFLALSIVGGGAVANPDEEVLSNRKGWNADDWSTGADESQY
ncbi:MAG: hypothetical protein J1F06_01415 [Prevotellaceae bacterium]|nr:hypothetical protein [Prevotellaceae bacterium]